MYICGRLVVKPFGYAKQTISKHKLSGSPIRVSTFNCIKNQLTARTGYLLIFGLKLVSSRANYSKLVNESRKLGRINPDKVKAYLGKHRTGKCVGNV